MCVCMCCVNTWYQVKGTGNSKTNIKNQWNATKNYNENIKQSHITSMELESEKYFANKTNTKQCTVTEYPCQNEINRDVLGKEDWSRTGQKVYSYRHKNKQQAENCNSGYNKWKF